MKNKKVVYTIIGIISLLLVAAAVTYAYWVITKSQTNKNTISAACLDISLSNESDAISLADQFPITDEDGLSSTPYTFTVTNNCNTSLDYQIALEALGTESEALSSDALKVALDDNVLLLSNYASVDPTISDAYASYRLITGTLESKGSEGSSVTYELRIWIDEDASNNEQNKTFTSKISVTVGQGIVKLPPAETAGTLAYDILSNYGGVEGRQTLEPEWSAGEYGTQSSKFIYSGSSYYWSTEMAYNDEIGMYELTGEVFLANLEECRNGQKSDGTSINCAYTLYSNSSLVSRTGFKVVSLTNSQGDSYITAQTIETVVASSIFSETIVEGEHDIYKTEDDLGTSYYFRGDANNNYVEFGKYIKDIIKYRGYYSEGSTSVREYDSLEDCQNAESYNINCTEIIYAKVDDPMYWRIVRINGDGTIRLVYDGTEKVANGIAHTATIKMTKYNTSGDNEKFVGYTYNTSDTDSTQVDSLIKSELESWYENNLESDYGKYISDSIFCNDRSINKYLISKNANYTPNFRIHSSGDPTLKCANKEDRYTKDDTTNGNGALKYPIGLITVDEIVFGGKEIKSGEENTSLYLYSGEQYWTSSPRYYNGSTAVLYASNLGTAGATSYFGIRPVINLKADIKFEGDGSIDTPYTIVTE